MATDAQTSNINPIVADTYRLRLPGPIAVPERVRQAIARPVLNHRGPEFREIWGRTIKKLQPVMGTTQPVHIFACSGTGVMEAALLNILAPGERLLIVSNGQWGERFQTIGKALGAEIDAIVVPWGENVDPVQVEAKLKASEYRALIVIHNESSTGVVGDLQTMGKLVRDRPTLLVTDSVSGIAGMDFQMDAWGVDVVVTGSQKALMCPPGMGIIAASEKAWAVIRRESGMPRFYLDLRKARDSYGFAGSRSRRFARHDPRRRSCQRPGTARTAFARFQGRSDGIGPRKLRQSKGAIQYGCLLLAAGVRRRDTFEQASLRKAPDDHCRSAKSIAGQDYPDRNDGSDYGSGYFD
jgi:Aminotransferase class-V